MKNKIKSILLLMLIVPCLFLFVACGKDNGNQNGSNNNNQTGNEDDSNVKSYSEGLAYVLSSDETYYIVTGIGSCEDSKVVIPSTYKNKPVKEIKAKAFLECDNLTSVNIPICVIRIGESAFSGCSSLKEMTLPFVGASETEKTFLGYLFGASEYSKNSDYVPESLKKVTITSATSIGDYAFYSCDSLISITIPNSVTSIGEKAFGWCSKLVEVYNLSSLNIVKSSKDNGIVCYYAKDIYTSLDEPSKLKTINGVVYYINGAEKIAVALEDINATSIVIDNDCTEIYQYAFQGCSSLTSITIPNSVTSIEGSAFKNCSSLTSITIPNSVTSIGWSAFSGCSSLTKVYYNGTSSDWNKIFIYDYNSRLENATRYYYSETKPTKSGNYWHYDTDGTTILIWQSLL